MATYTPGDGMYDFCVCGIRTIVRVAVYYAAHGGADIWRPTDLYTAGNGTTDPI